MAFILVYLHGKRGFALSNQMRDGKSMAPGYSVDWWQANKLSPPRVDPAEFLWKRIEWRYAKGFPSKTSSRAVLGDSTVVLKRLANRIADGAEEKFDFVFTSPPYYGVTNYHYDQWLRLWMLGGTALPTSYPHAHRGRFGDQVAYGHLIHDVFALCKATLKRTGSLYVRTDARDFTKKITVQALRSSFPTKKLRIIKRPLARPSQTALYGDRSEKPGEVDIVVW